MSRHRPKPKGANRVTPQSLAQASLARAGNSLVPAGSSLRPVNNQPAMLNIATRPTGSNWAGDNSQPVSAYDPSGPGRGDQTGMTAFPPGDPVRPASGFNLRQWMYPVGGNIGLSPRSTEMTSFETLRNLSSMYDVIGLCELAHFRIIERLSLVLRPRKELLDAGEDQTAEKWTRPARQMQEWFEDGPDKRGGDLTSWLIAVMKDLLEIDAVGILNRPTRDGRLHSLDLIAGDTIQCLWDVEGRPPLPPYPAYRQIAYGGPGPLFQQAREPRLDGTQLDYLKIVNRTNSMYGQPPVERIILTINSALRKQHYDLTRFTAGSTPEGVMQTTQPELLTMTVDQVNEWEANWNAALSGNDALRHQTKVVPPGWTFTSTEQAAIATEFDEMLLNKTVSAFGLTKDELGFTDTSNRSVGQSQEAVTYRQAIMPRTSRLADYITRVIRRYHGTPLSVVGRSISLPGSPTQGSGTWDARFVADWEGIEEPEDFTSKTNAYATLVGAGIVGRTEAKRALNLPIGKGEVEIPPMILAPAGPDSMVILADLVKQRDQINEAHKAGLDSKIAGAKAAEDQFKAGGNPVMAAGMASGNVNAGAQQAVKAGGATGGQHAQAAKPAGQQSRAPQNAKQNTGGQGRQLAQRQEWPEAWPEEERTDEYEDDDSLTTQWDARGAPVGSGAAGRRDVAGAGEDAMGRPESDPAGADAGTGRGASATGLAAGGAAGRGDGRANTATAGLRGDGDATGQGIQSALDRRDVRGDGTGEGLALRGRQPGTVLHTTDDGSIYRADTVPSAIDSQRNSDDNGVARRDAESDQPQEARAYSTEEISDEWARYRERALKDAKRGKLPRPFLSEILPAGLHVWVENRLKSAGNPESVRAVFNEAREREGQHEREAGVASAEIASSAPPPTPVPTPVVAASGAEGDPMDRLILALASRVESVALSEYRSSLADLKTRVTQALPY